MLPRDALCMHALGLHQLCQASDDVADVGRLWELFVSSLSCPLYFVNCLMMGTQVSQGVKMPMFRVWQSYISIDAPV